MSIIISPDLEYESLKSEHSNVKWTKVQCQNNADFVAGTATSIGSGLYELVIPSSVFNLAKSRLSFKVRSATTTGVPVCAVSPSQYISRVSLSTLSGTLLADISSFNKYAHMILPMSTKKSDLDTYANGIPAFSSTDGTLLSASSAPITSAQADLFPYGALCRSDKAFVAANAVNTAIAQFTNMIGDTARHPTQHMGIQTWAYQTAIGEVDLTFTFSLEEMFKHTALALDKLLYFGESLSLQIYFAPPNDSLFACLPVAGATAGAQGYNAGDLTKAGLIDNAGTVYTTNTITAPVVLLYQEMNLDIARKVIEKSRSEGFLIPFSYIYTNRNVIGNASTSHTIQNTINSSLGSSVLFIASAPYQTNDTKNAFNSNQINTVVRGATSAAVAPVTSTAIALNSYNTFIDSIPISNPAGFDVTKSEHYYANQASFEHSCSPLSITEYNCNWTHVDNFTGNSLSSLDQTIRNGVSLGATRTYSLQAIWGTACVKNWYTFTSVQRVLSIKDGVTRVM